MRLGDCLQKLQNFNYSGVIVFFSDFVNAPTTHLLVFRGIFALHWYAVSSKMSCCLAIINPFGTMYDYHCKD